MVSSENFSAIMALDLEQIKQKLMHRKAGKGWTRERVDAVETEYRRFLCMAKSFRDAPIAPAADVDEFWHYHILDTKKYAADCEHVFGYFLHHFPYAGMRGRDDEEAMERIGERTRAMYEQMFGESYLVKLAAVGAPPRPGFSAAVRLSKAFGAPPTGATFRYSPSAKQAAKTAFCYVTDAGAAAAAFCYVTDSKPNAATFCYVADAKADAATFCYVADAKADAATFCYVTDGRADAATFCYVTDGRAPGAGARHGWEGKEQEQAIKSRPLEDRAGFYMERPGLPAA
jgi:hypothetical protein